jgi:murein DD-endopeptidase MepM/ murein hydrolase activator NlpD
VSPRLVWFLVFQLGLGLGLQAQPFQLPTANRDIFQPGGETRYFAGTPGRSWTSGTFGCVRSDGQQLHEGWDIRATGRDAQGEPTDEVRATADGVVAYVNDRPALSNYGRFVIVQHRVDGLEIYSIYAHLARFRAGLKAGQAVRAGEVLGIMGRTANTAQSIAKDRAHLHFELGLRVSDRFSAWQRKHFPGQRNDHGEFNGRNFISVDPLTIFREQQRQGARFNLVRVLQNQTLLCRVQVRATRFAWLRRYPQLVAENPRAARDGTAGYEIWLNYHGLPYRLVPLAEGELKSRARYHLIEVNAAEQQARPCGKLVARSGSGWRLTATGERWLDLLTE